MLVKERCAPQGQQKYLPSPVHVLPLRRQPARRRSYRHSAKASPQTPFYPGAIAPHHQPFTRSSEHIRRKSSHFF